jgi:subtilisin family serine protease
LRLKLLRDTAAIAISAVAVLSGATPARAVAEPVPAPSAGKLLRSPTGEAVKDSYIVVLKDGKVTRSGTGAMAQKLAGNLGGRVGHVYTSALQGFEVSVDEAAARRLAADPAVEFVQQNTVVRPQDTQVNPPNQGLDRLDQRTWPLDNAYTFPTTAPNVRVYVIDSGIRASHLDFGGRVLPGVDVVFGGPAVDCSGHGTHVAGIVGGAAFGVAKSVTIVPVKVFGGCSPITDSGSVMAGIDWVTAHHNTGELAVANVSLGGGGPDVAVNLAVNRSIADGIVYTVAAGNNDADACGFSPANVSDAITVGATLFTGSDLRASFSNFGSCVDLSAPGNQIRSAWNSSDRAVADASGTSMASAFAAGVAAVFWSMHPSRTAAQITTDVVHNALHGVLPFHGSGPNRHLSVPRIIISPLRALGGVGGMPISNQLSAAGGTPPYAWAATGLPPAATINPTTGLISGRLSDGTYTVTVTVTDAVGRTGNATATWQASPIRCC